MKSSLLKLALIAPLAALLAAPSHAQVGQKAISLEIGGNYAADGDVRDATQDVGIHVGVGYSLPMKPTASGRASWTTLGLMYNKNSGNGNELSVWGLTAEQRYSLASPRSYSTTTPYVGLGLGVYRVHGEADGEDIILETATAGSGAGEVPEDTNVDETKTRIGGRFIVGVDFNRAYYIEAAYNLTGKVLDTRSDSITLSAGARF